VSFIWNASGPVAKTSKNRRNEGRFVVAIEWDLHIAGFAIRQIGPGARPDIVRAALDRKQGGPSHAHHRSRQKSLYKGPRSDVQNVALR